MRNNEHLTLVDPETEVVEDEEPAEMGRKQVAGLVLVGGCAMAVMLAGLYLVAFAQGIASAIGAVLVLCVLLLLSGIALAASSNDDGKRGQ